MRLLDLFCGAGGAAVGYHQAGFDDIVGIDNVSQPNYPFTFIQADALDFLDAMIDGQEDIGYDLIHASPPCPLLSAATTKSRDRHVNLVSPTRQLIELLDRPWVMENVPNAPLQGNVIELCGSMFGLRSGVWILRRHRRFELSTSFPLMLVPPHNHRVEGRVASVVGRLAHETSRTHAPGHKSNGMRASFQDAKKMMGVEWMSNRNQGHEISEAIPPAYTKFIGEQFLAQ